MEAVFPDLKEPQQLEAPMCNGCEIDWTASDGVRWETLEKDVAHVKLTIAKNRVTVKFPQNMPVSDQARYMAFCHKIAEAVGPVEYTLRGAFKDNYVFMHTGRRSANSRYFCGGVEGTPPERG